MRTLTALFLIGLVVMTMAKGPKNSTQQGNKKEAKAPKNMSLVELEQHPFGSSLLDLVQINMQSNSQDGVSAEHSLDQITKLLNDMNTDMQKNKKQGDAEHKDFQAKADRDIAQYKKIIAAEKARREQVQKQLATDRKQLKETQDDLKEAQAHLAQVNANIKSADEEHARATAAFDKKHKELNEGIAACKEANAELSKLKFVGASFVEGATLNLVQIQGQMQKVESIISQHLPARLVIYRPLVAVLAQLGTNANPELVNKVMGLINELKSALEAELAQTIKDEKQRVADYTQYRADLVKDQRNTQQRIGRNQVMIKNLNKKIRDNQAVLDALNISIPNNEKLLALREQEKATDIANYTRDNKSREEELAVIAELMNHFESKISSSMSAHLKSRVQ